jgi:hypothetical protein
MNNNNHTEQLLSSTWLAVQAKEYATAERQLRDALCNLELSDGDNCSQLPPLLQALAQVLHLQQRHRESVAVMRRANQIAREYLHATKCGADSLGC